MTEQDLIKQVVEGIVEKLGFPATVMVTVPTTPDETFFCSIQVEDGQNFLIGQYGMNLAALQHIVRVLVRKRTEKKLDIIVDINNYFSEKKQLLEREATRALEEALQQNVSVALRPMLPYERKIVHAFLSRNPSVKTESVGLGAERKILVRPLPTREQSIA